MCSSRCAAGCCGAMTRRGFLSASAAAAGAVMLGGRLLGAQDAPPAGEPAWQGPGRKYQPILRACFVRRKGEYGMRWPGQVYDGEAARKIYIQKIQDAGKDLNVKLDLRELPLYSLAESKAWLAQAKDAQADGLLVVLLDRQEHAWPTANLAIDSGLPTVVYSPVGSSFTTNTAGPSRKGGAVVYSTDDFSQPAYGLKMLAAGARMKRTKVVVIEGARRREAVLPQLGIQLQYVPAATFVNAYNALGEGEEMRKMADAYIAQSAGLVGGATRQDVINGARSYMTARQILQDEQADGISMDCLGSLGPTKLSLPCLAWSKMNDDAIPAACEADVGAVASHVIVQYLFDRPGFQQDPVGETAKQAIIGAHCSCPTRLNGFGRPGEPYTIRHHHAQRDATPHPTWKIGQDVTSLDVEWSSAARPARATKAGGAATQPATQAAPASAQPPQAELIISAGKVVENVQVPPAGGCVISVMVKFDNVEDVLAYPGFHQIFFYGHYKRHLVDFCRLFKLTPRVV